MVIRTAYHMVRINSENAGRVLEDDAYMSVLFQFAYAFLSLRDIFSNICEYEEVLTMILKVASDPKESLKREGSVIETVVISLTKSRNGFYTKKEELVPLFLEILEIARDPGESSKRATLLEALRKGIGEAEGSNCGLSTKKIEISSGAQGGKEVSKSASEGYLSSSSLSLSTNCDSPVELFTKPTKIVRKNAKYTTLVEPDMYEHSEFSGCMLKSVNKLEKVSVNCVKNALGNLKQTFSEIQEQHLHLPEMQQETGNNTPSIKFKSILLILKELMTNIRKRHKGAYTTLRGYVKTKTSEDDMNISDISYRFVENTPENVGNCDHLERLLWFGLSRSMQTMIGLHESMKDDFLSIQQVSKASGRELHLDEESFDSLLYLVACVRQMKKDLKQRLKGFRMKTDYCHLLYEGSNVYQKLDIFYKKQWELVKDLSLDFNFCRNYSNLNLEVAKAFRMLIEELELRDFSEEESRE
ncbi:hypothetical protein IFM89_013003 [Coptis chinensis]|uniref:Uncharacterized protein n=1 Tax=Coptis chinensis TaxID=261450 RepID=A0A835GW67_9MAGN|nr:hypothetical protein IFM89_013003 [Coptis chinensis]